MRVPFGETRIPETFNGALAQLGERNAGSVEVTGSIPVGSTNSQFYTVSLHRRTTRKCLFIMVFMNFCVSLCLVETLD